MRADLYVPQGNDAMEGDYGRKTHEELARTSYICIVRMYTYVCICTYDDVQRSESCG